MRVLAWDVGGTTTRLQLVDFDTPEPRGNVVAEQLFESSRYPSLATLAGEFLDAHPSEPVTAACLAVAGPVRAEDDGQRVQLTNLPWQEQSSRLADRLAIPCLSLINDFEAAGYGIESLTDEDRLPLQAGIASPHAPRLPGHAGVRRDLIGKDAACRTVEHEGTVYEAIPERLMRAAACRATGIC